MFYLHVILSSKCTHYYDQMRDFVLLFTKNIYNQTYINTYKTCIVTNEAAI